jgi:hypothetical protein
MHYHGQRVSREQRLDGTKEVGAQECQGGTKDMVQLPNGAFLPLGKCDILLD